MNKEQLELSRQKNTKKQIPINISEINIERFFSKISVNKNNNCWEWIDSLAIFGYGSFYNGKNLRAHRVSYAIFNGQLIDNLVIDHICRNRACVNPEHLRQVDYKTNATENSNSVAALNVIKTQCNRGHVYTDDNTFLNQKGRTCKECFLIRQRERAFRLPKIKPKYDIRRKNSNKILINKSDIDMIKNIRIKNGLSQEQMASKLQITRNILAKIETGINLKISKELYNEIKNIGKQNERY